MSESEKFTGKREIDSELGSEDKLSYVNIFDCNFIDCDVFDRLKMWEELASTNPQEDYGLSK